MASKLGLSRNNEEEIRIVMVGKTGIGKSASGNTILGRECFKSKFSPKSMTVDCSKGKAVVDGQRVAVIDTPGLFDTRFGKDRTNKDLSQCIYYTAPGPHVFLVVMQLGRYTEEEKQTVQRIQEMFGEDADKYSMVLFTHGDELKNMTIEDFLMESSHLQELVKRCNNQYHVFNNELKEDRSQVTELLQKIRNLNEKNRGSHYTNEMFQKAERVVEEEKQRILKEKEEQIRKEKEELERKLEEKYEQQMKTMIEEKEKERKEREERERERKEREQERERKEREEERERKEREEERERKEREEREREWERKEREKREREMERIESEYANMINKMKEEKDKELREEKEKLQNIHNTVAREEAERSNLVSRLFKVVVDKVVDLLFNSK